MNEMTEQEKLAQLVSAGNTEVEEYNSADMIASSLLKSLGGIDKRMLTEVEQEITSRGDNLDHSPISSFSSDGRPTQPAAGPKKDANLIRTLKVIHQGLIDVFERSGLNSGVENHLVSLIEASSACLNYLGERTDKFEPLRHLSGLQAPNMVKNANKVLETTLSCYQIGKIEDPVVSDDGSEISIVFTGRQKDIEYRAYGKVMAKSWEGSEALDYIYTPGSGQMSVKAFEGGKWIDKSGSSNYNVNWELEETDLSLKENEQENSNQPTVQEIEVVASEENIPSNKEVLSQSLNNEINEDEEIAFPISDDHTVEDSDI